jgi:hypothetical protein
MQQTMIIASSWNWGQQASPTLKCGRGFRNRGEDSKQWRLLVVVDGKSHRYWSLVEKRRVGTGDRTAAGESLFRTRPPEWARGNGGHRPLQPKALALVCPRPFSNKFLVKSVGHVSVRLGHLNEANAVSKDIGSDPEPIPTAVKVG